MNSTYTVQNSRIEASSAASTWWIVFVRELHELWIGGKAPILLFIFTILLGIMTFVLATNSELSLIPPQEMVYETLKAAIAVSLFIGLIIGADSISGERERATLESLLLTPTSRRQLVVGKFLAGISVWPVALAITIPYMSAISQGHEVFRHAVPWGAIVGTILAPTFTGIGMLASMWSNSNKTSLFVGLGLYVLFMLPTTLPGRANTGFMGNLLQQVNPIMATTHFLSKILVNNRLLSELWVWFLSPVLFAVLVFGLLFLYASPSLRLEGGKASKFWSSLGRYIGVGMCVAVCLLVSLSPSPALAAVSLAPQQSLQISMDLEYQTVKTGDHVLYNTVVTNNGMEKSPPLVVAMNIVNLNAAGDIVDPEDWSPQRTQYLETLTPGQSASLGWRLNAILDGNYLVYMVLIPEPAGKDATSQPVASSGLHLTVTPFTRLNPRGVLPYAIGGPIALALGMVFIYRRRRRSIDMGGSA
jgi:ABC-2 type transport system permease protein